MTVSPLAVAVLGKSRSICSRVDFCVGVPYHHPRNYKVKPIQSQQWTGCGPNKIIFEEARTRQNEWPWSLLNLPMTIGKNSWEIKVSTSMLVASWDGVRWSFLMNVMNEAPTTPVMTMPVKLLISIQRFDLVVTTLFKSRRLILYS